MTNWRRVAIGTLGAILFLALAGALAIHALVDPERLKETARGKAHAAWGRELSIGEAALDLWPLPALHAEDIALANPDGAEEPYFLRAEGLVARLELLPLLIGKVRLKSLAVKGLRVELETLSDGSSNVPSSSAKREAASSDLLNLTSVIVEDADIHHRVKGAEPTVWHVDSAALDASPGLREVRIEARIARDDLPLTLKARLADASRFGIDGAASDGSIALDWGTTQLAIAGKLPLGPKLRGYAVTADLKSTGLGDMAAFLESAQRPRAAAAGHLEIRDVEGAADIPKLDLTVGKLRVTGSARIALASAKKTFSARLEADRIDWAQTMLDFGGRVLPPLAPEELFYDVPLAWPLLVSLRGTEGAAEVNVRSLRLRNGVELTNAKARIALDGDRLRLDPFAAEMLGGRATGSLLFEGRRKSVKVDFNGTDLLLQRWFEERGSQIPLTGGPMKIAAKFTSTGDSIKGFAATVTGPIAIRMGPAVWSSKKAGDAEALMTDAFAAKDASRIDFECVAANLPFHDGIARASPMVGFRTTASALTTGGTVDLRQQVLDLGGRVKPESGVRLGLATIAGDVKIAGNLRRPQMTLDPASTPGLIARAGAAIATLGISAVGTAMVDAADARKNDPCNVVFR